MLKSVTMLLIFQLIGEVAVRALTLPIPGPVIGMFLLYGMLSVRGSAPESLTRTANGLLSHLSLLYVPAGVGVMVHLALIKREWLAVLLTLVVSTALTLVITALTMRWLVARAASASAPSAMRGR
jgi:holin-like protein